MTAKKTVSPYAQPYVRSFFDYCGLRPAGEATEWRCTAVNLNQATAAARVARPGLVISHQPVLQSMPSMCVPSATHASAMAVLLLPQTTRLPRRRRRQPDERLCRPPRPWRDPDSLSPFPHALRRARRSFLPAGFVSSPCHQRRLSTLCPVSWCPAKPSHACLHGCALQDARASELARSIEDVKGLIRRSESASKAKEAGPRSLLPPTRPCAQTASCPTCPLLGISQNQKASHGHSSAQHCTPDPPPLGVWVANLSGHKLHRFSARDPSQAAVPELSPAIRSALRELREELATELRTVVERVERAQPAASPTPSLVPDEVRAELNEIKALLRSTQRAAAASTHNVRYGARELSLPHLVSRPTSAHHCVL